MSALGRPTPGELCRGAIAAAVRNGRITPQEAEMRLRDQSLDALPTDVRVDTSAVAKACEHAGHLHDLIVGLKGPGR